MKKKKVMLNNLKPGQKFRYARKLYVKDQLHCYVQISNGKIPDTANLPDNTLVTPVKVKITVL